MTTFLLLLQHLHIIYLPLYDLLFSFCFCSGLARRRQCYFSCFKPLKVVGIRYNFSTSTFSLSPKIYPLYLSRLASPPLLPLLSFQPPAQVLHLFIHYSSATTCHPNDTIFFILASTNVSFAPSLIKHQLPNPHTTQSAPNQACDIRMLRMQPWALMNTETKASLRAYKFAQIKLVSSFLKSLNQNFRKSGSSRVNEIIQHIIIQHGRIDCWATHKPIFNV